MFRVRREMTSSASSAVSTQMSGTLVFVLVTVAGGGGTAAWARLVAVVAPDEDGEPEPPSPLGRMYPKRVPATNSSPSAATHHQRGRAGMPKGDEAATGGAGGSRGFGDRSASSPAGSNIEPMRAPISAKLRRISSSSCCWRCSSRCCSSRSVAMLPSPQGMDRALRRRRCALEPTDRGHGPVRTVDALRAGRLQRSRHTPANRQTYVVLGLPPLACTTGG